MAADESDNHSYAIPARGWFSRIAAGVRLRETLETIDQLIKGFSSDGERLDITDILFTTSSTPAHEEGLTFYNSDEKTISYFNDSNNVEINVGQEQVFRGKNVTGGEVTDGDVVQITGGTGAVPEFVFADSSADAIRRTIGVVTEPIPNNQIGYVTTFGIVRNLDTSAFSAGDTLFISSTPGEFTNTIPSYPEETSTIGIVARSHASEGRIHVNTERWQPRVRIEDSRSTAPANPPAGQAIIWQTDGTNVGADGDILATVTDEGGTTKTATLVDFSAT